MIVRINYIYEDDCDFEDFEEGERFGVSSDALTISFQILDTPDDEEALDEREGELSSNFEYELHDGQLCAIVDGKFSRAKTTTISNAALMRWGINREFLSPAETQRTQRR